MNTYLKRLMTRARLMKPAEEGDSGASAAVDRGDTFEPTAEDVEAATKAGTISAEDAEAERAKLGLKAATPKPAAATATPDEEDPEEDEDPEEGDAPAKPTKKDDRLPRSRHEAILAGERAKREAAEREVASLKEGKVIAKTNEQIAELETKVAGLETQYAEAMAEGETKKAAALMKEIRQSERTIIEQKAEFRSQLATAQAVESIRFEAACDRLETAFPQLKEGGPEFDAEIASDVVELRDAYMLKGYSATDAIQRAVDKLLKPATAKQEAAVSVTPRVNATEATAAAKKLERDVAARKKNADTANAQPPALATTGANSDEAGGKLDALKIIKLPFSEFMKIGDDDLARARGDTL